jgi:hypothetical protein
VDSGTGRRLSYLLLSQTEPSLVWTQLKKGEFPEAQSQAGQCLQSLRWLHERESLGESEGGGGKEEELIVVKAVMAVVVGFGLDRWRAEAAVRRYAERDPPGIRNPD